jgi:hypothetical protein
MAEGDGASNVKNLWKPMILNELKVLLVHPSEECWGWSPLLRAYQHSLKLNLTQQSCVKLLPP